MLGMKGKVPPAGLTGGRPVTHADYRHMATEIRDLIPLLVHPQTAADLRLLPDRYERLAEYLEVAPGRPLEFRRQAGLIDPERAEYGARRRCVAPPGAWATNRSYSSGNGRGLQGYCLPSDVSLSLSIALRSLSPLLRFHLSISCCDYHLQDCKHHHVEARPDSRYWVHGSEEAPDRVHRTISRPSQITQQADSGQSQAAQQGSYSAEPSATASSGKAGKHYEFTSYALRLRCVARLHRQRVHA